MACRYPGIASAFQQLDISGVNGTYPGTLAVVHAFAAGSGDCKRESPNHSTGDVAYDGSRFGVLLLALAKSMA